MNSQDKDAKVGFFRFILEIMFGSTKAEREGFFRVQLPWLSVFLIFWAGTNIAYSRFMLADNLILIGLILLTAVFAIILLLKYISFLGQIDEYTRRIITEGNALGAGITMGIFLIYQLAELAGAPEITSFRSIIILGFMMLLSHIFVAFKYR